MKKSTKIILCTATLWPILYIAIFFVFAFTLIFLFSQKGATPLNIKPTWFFIIFCLHFLTILWIIILEAIYILNVFRNNRVEKDKKALWAVILFLGSIIAMPIYWYIYIWRESDESIEGTPYNKA